MSELRDVQSMTGHAVLERQIGSILYRFQVKSVNHRFLELKFKAPRAWSALEVSVKQMAQAKLRRGSVEMWVEKIQVEANPATTYPMVQNLFADLEKALRNVSGVSQFMVPGPLRALILSRHPELWQRHQQSEETWNEKMEAELSGVFDQLLTELVKKRQEEGRSLIEVLKGILAQLSAHLKLLEDKIPEGRKAWEDKIRGRFRELANELQLTAMPEDRIFAEFLILAEKRDVAEEMDRIKIHLGTLRDLLEKGDTHLGKRLDFLMQELHREWTTLGNKIQNANLAPWVMEAKLGIEQIREQIQNLI